MSQPLFYNIIASVNRAGSLHFNRGEGETINKHMYMCTDRDTDVQSGSEDYHKEK